jgi:antitoxin CptB
MDPNTADATEIRRRRLRFRSWHRGTRELDLLLGPFADARLDTMDATELDQYEAVLQVPDPDIYNWIVQREAIPEHERSAVLNRIIEFHNDR